MNFLKDIENLISRFGSWVEDLFNHSKKAWEALTETEQQVAQWAYGVIAIINANVNDLSPVLDIIAEKYPTLSPDVLHGFLDTLIKDIGIVQTDTPLTLQQAIQEIAKYLGTLKGDFWSGMSQIVGSLLSILFSPDTPVQKFIAAAEYGYRAIVKPHVEN